MSCPTCMSADLVAVDLQIAREPVRFCHCRSCEHRWWTSAGGPLVLNSVLSRVARS